MAEQSTPTYGSNPSNALLANTVIGSWRVRPAFHRMELIRMKFSSSIRAHCLFGAIVIILTMSALPISSTAAELSEAYDITDEDLALLPQYCVAKITRKSDTALQAQWTQRFGAANWLHMHHHCFGLKALRLAYQNYADPIQRSYQAGVAINNFDYVLRHTEPNFFMRPEILVERGRALVLKREFTRAEQGYLQALKVNKKNVDAWAALGDLYSQMGNDGQAIKVLEQAIEETGEEHKKLKSRLDDLRRKTTR